VEEEEENKLKIAYVIRKTYESSFNLSGATLDLLLKKKRNFRIKEGFFFIQDHFQLLHCLLQEKPNYLDA